MSNLGENILPARWALAVFSTLCISSDVPPGGGRESGLELSFISPTIAVSRTRTSKPGEHIKALKQFTDRERVKFLTPAPQPKPVSDYAPLHHLPSTANICNL